MQLFYLTETQIFLIFVSNEHKSHKNWLNPSIIHGAYLKPAKN
jgi:hypothetical protein